MKPPNKGIQMQLKQRCPHCNNELNINFDKKRDIVSCTYCKKELTKEFIAQIAIALLQLHRKNTLGY
jgi:uncharacterized protein (DUF983 family)